MSKVCAIFIDGGYLKAILKNNNNFSLDYFELSNKISKIINAERLRTYYYDCLPALIEHNEKSKKLFQDKEKFLEKINSLPRFEIKLGKLQRIGNTFRQKKIDVLMSLDIVDKCFEKQIQHAVLIAGDADFIPAIKKAKDHGAVIHLFAQEGSLNKEILSEIDEIHYITKDFLEDCKIKS